MNNRFFALGALLTFTFVAACAANPTNGGAAKKDPPPSCSTPGIVDCASNAHYDDATCTCVPDGTCADPGICGGGMHWDSMSCSCEPYDQCVDAPCPIGSEWVVSACACLPIGDGGPPPACFIPGYGECGFGQTCVVGYCNDSSSPITCYCDAQGNTSCSGACEGPDGGPPPPPVDGGPQPPDAGQACWLPGVGYCAPNTSCITGYCPDNITPVSCFCEGNGVSQCTGACPSNPPPPPVDAGSGH